VPGVLDWNTAIIPVLEAAYECSGEPEGFADLGEVDVDALNRRLGRERHDPGTTAALRSLKSSGYVQVTDGGPDQVDGFRLFALTDKALQLVAGWPSTTGEAALAKLVAELNERIGAEPDEEKKGKLVRLRDGVLDVGKEVAAGVLTKVLTGE
jgi:hypothetical protein